MSLLTVPNVFANGTGPSNIIDATQMNANFTAVATAVNNIYPSQILPITSGQATFGATATGVGYKFLANDATATPLTVSGVSGQSADIFDVTLTSGGTKVLGVNSAGTLLLPLTGTTAILIGAKGSDQTGTGGILMGSVATGSAYTQLIVNAATTVQTVVGSALVINLDGNSNNFAFSRAGNLGIAGTLSQASQRSRKKNITPWEGDALADVLAVKVQRYHFLEEADSDEQHTGFIADEVPSSLVRGGTSVEPYSVAVMALAAIQQLAVRIERLESSH